MQQPPLDDCYRTLEIEPGASLKEIREAYRVLSRVWHPDRFVGSPELHARATERQQGLNVAYQRLVREYRAAAGGPRFQDVPGGRGTRSHAAPPAPDAHPPASRVHSKVPERLRTFAASRRAQVATAAALLIATAVLFTTLLSSTTRVRTADGAPLRATLLGVGGEHACAGNAASAWCWPAEGTAHDIPLAGAAVTVTGGLVHSCALLASGRAQCWGANFAGQLGRGGIDDSDEPVTVRLDDSFARLSTFARHTCGVTTDGALYCWGDDTDGQLGVGAPVASCTFDAVRFHCSDLPERVGGRYAQVSAGGSHTCALDNAAALYCWGSNRHGQLGDAVPDRCIGPGGPAACSRRPVRVPGLSAVAHVSAGASHTCALDTDGRAFCWGSNARGQIGTSLESDVVSTPTAVASTLRFRTLSAGAYHTCGITSDSDVYCWGSDADGELNGRGRQSCADGSCSPEPVRLTRDAAGVQAGFGRTCVIRSDVVHCWGGGVAGSAERAERTDVVSRARAIGRTGFAAARRAFQRIVIGPLEQVF